MTDYTRIFAFVAVRAPFYATAGVEREIYPIVSLMSAAVIFDYFYVTRVRRKPFSGFQYYVLSLRNGGG